MKLSKMVVAHERFKVVFDRELWMGNVQFEGQLIIVLTKLGGSEVLPRVQFDFLTQVLNEHVVGSIDWIEFRGVAINLMSFQTIQETEPERLKARMYEFRTVDARSLSVDNLKQLLSR